MTETYDGDGWRCEWEWRNDGAGPGIASQSYREPLSVELTDEAEFVDAYGDGELARFHLDPEGWASQQLQQWDCDDYRRCGFDD